MTHEKAMKVLEDQPRIGLGQLAERLGVSRSSAYLALKRLENEGRIIRKSHPLGSQQTNEYEIVKAADPWREAMAKAIALAPDDIKPELQRILDGTKKRRGKQQLLVTDKPDWLKQETLDAWIAFRKQLKRPIVNESLPALYKTLDKMRQSGEDVDAAIFQSIANGWQGIFPVKQKVGETQLQAEERKRRERIEETARMMKR